MYRIRQVYLDYVGFKGAWFQDVQLPFYAFEGEVSDENQEKQQAALDSIISLTNGGGKTTLLSLIFSNFVPRQERFVQHLQKPHHHFKDYFDKYPGLILIELERQEKAYGEVDISERLVLGQFVAIEESTGEAKRKFFGFTPSSELSFETVPSMSRGQITAMEDVRKWVNQVSGEPTFNTTEVQSEWSRWLNSEAVGIDTWIINKQVDFCRAEGGIENYMQFASEKDFLKEFFYMVLPPNNAEEIREILSESLHKLRKRPEYERQKKLLNRLQNRLEPFGEEAEYYNLTEKNLQQKQEEGQKLYSSLEKRIEEKQVSLSSLLQLKKNAENEGNSLLVKQHSTEARLEAAELFHKSLEIQELEKLLKQMELNLAEFQQEEKLGNAALSFQKKQLLEADIEDLSETLETAGDDLTPLKKRRNEAAWAYKEKLEQVLVDTREQITSLNEERKTLQQKQSENNQKSSDIQQEMDEKVKEVSKNEYFITERNNQIEKLQAMGILGFSEDPSRKKEKLETEKVDLEKKVNELKAGVLEKEKKIELINRNIQETSERITGFKVDISGLETEVSEGLIQKQKLQKNRHLVSIMSTDEFDPSSPELSLKLKSFLDRKTAEAEESQSLISGFKERVRLIEETGSAMADGNIAMAVNALKEMGIAPVEFYPDYLAAMIGSDSKLSQKEKEKKIAEKIESDPGKYSGIGLNKEGIEKLKVSDLRLEGLSRPILVSEITRADVTFDNASNQQSVLTIKPANESLYSKESIDEVLENLKKQVETRQTRLKELSVLHNELVIVQNQLAEYVEVWGSRRLEEKEERLEFLRAELTMEDNQIEGFKKELAVNREDFLLQSTSLNEIQDHYQKVLHDYERLEQFIQEFEKEFDLRKQRVGIFNESLEKSREDMKVLSSENLSLQEKQDELIKKETLLSEEIRLKRKLRDEIQLPDNFKTEVEVDLSATEEVFRMKFDNVEQSIRQKQSDTGLNEVIAKKELLESELKKIREEFSFVSDGLEFRLIEKKATKSEAFLKDALKNIRHEADKIRELSGARQESLRRLEREKKDLEVNRKHKASNWQETDLDLEQMEVKISRLEAELEVCLKEQDEIQGEIKESVKRIYTEESGVKESQLLLQSLIEFRPENTSSDSVISDLPYEQGALNNYVSAFSSDIKDLKDKLANATYMADKAYKKVIEVVQDEEFRMQENRIAVEIERNSFPDVCHHVERHLRLTSERIQAIEHEIQATQEDLDLCVTHLLNHASNAISKLRFVTKKSNIPETVPELAGKRILRVRSDISTLTQEHKRSQLEIYVHELAESQMIPNVSNETGDELTAEIISALAKAKNREGKLGIEIIKLSRMISYTPIDQIKGSGGESMTSALLLYLVLAQLRAESRADRKQVPGGFLMMDNPFSRATTPQLVKLQVELARNLGFQLIYATAIKDFNAQSLFPHIVQLRQVAHDRANDRVLVNRIESAEFTTFE